MPGGAHTDLLALGRIPDPFVGDNERRVQWVAEADWEYRYEFAVTPELLRQPHIRLVCDGLDTLATVSLNGHELGRTENMFRQYHWDVKPLLEAEGNELRIVFASVVKYAAQKQAESATCPVSHRPSTAVRTFARPPASSAGIGAHSCRRSAVWKDIRLEAFESARITEVHLRQFHANGVVKVEARRRSGELGARAFGPAAGRLRPTARFRLPAPPWRTATDNVLALQIENPQIWWPNGLGEQPLYRVQVQLNRVRRGSGRKNLSARAAHD